MIGEDEGEDCVDEEYDYTILSRSLVSEPAITLLVRVLGNETRIMA